MLYIHPQECIDCGACVPKCPVEAIFAEDDLPEELEEWLNINEEKTSDGALEMICEQKPPLPTAEEKRRQLEEKHP